MSVQIGSAEPDTRPHQAECHSPVQGHVDLSDAPSILIQFGMLQFVDRQRQDQSKAAHPLSSKRRSALPGTRSTSRSTDSELSPELHAENELKLPARDLILRIDAQVWRSGASHFDPSSWDSGTR
jgi:hypothetical protein